MCPRIAFCKVQPSTLGIFTFVRIMLTKAFCRNPRANFVVRLVPANSFCRGFSTECIASPHPRYSHGDVLESLATHRHPRQDAGGMVFVFSSRYLSGFAFSPVLRQIQQERRLQFGLEMCLEAIYRSALLLVSITCHSHMVFRESELLPKTPLRARWKKDDREHHPATPSIATWHVWKLNEKRPHELVQH